MTFNGSCERLVPPTSTEIYSLTYGTNHEDTAISILFIYKNNIAKSADVDWPQKEQYLI